MGVGLALPLAWFTLALETESESDGMRPELWASL